MHSYLFVGKNELDLEKTISSYTSSLKVKVILHDLAKIEDAKTLQATTKLSFSEPTAILIKNIESATEEALNAFLKNLEEPQENLYYFLTAGSSYAVLPTILSRCQVVRTINKDYAMENLNAMEKFLDSSLGEKFSFLEQFKKREEAVSFVSDLTNLIHSKISQGKNLLKLGLTAEVSLEALNNLKGNGNIALHLTNLAIKLDGFLRYN
jgi:hypothetical protein